MNVDDTSLDSPKCISEAFEIYVPNATVGDIIGKLVTKDEDVGDTHTFVMVRGTEYFEIVNDIQACYTRIRNPFRLSLSDCSMQKAGNAVNNIINNSYCQYTMVLHRTSSIILCIAI